MLVQCVFFNMTRLSCRLQATVIDIPVMCERYAVIHGEAFLVTLKSHS